MAIQALEKFYNDEVKITKELRDFMADTFTHKVYIKWKHQAALLQRLTLNAMGDEVYKEIQDAAGGKDAYSSSRPFAWLGSRSATAWTAQGCSLASATGKVVTISTNMKMIWRTLIPPRPARVDSVCGAGCFAR